jgi:hypothetical protein
MPRAEARKVDGAAVPQVQEEAARVAAAGGQDASLLLRRVSGGSGGRAVALRNVLFNVL